MSKDDNNNDNVIPMNPNELVTLNLAPLIIGYYDINNGLYFCFPNKPKLIHRIFTRLLLGWKWVDGNPF